MKFKFYLELATRVQEERLLDLLRIPDPMSLGQGTWNARWWSRGKTTRMQSTDREKILRNVAAYGINDLDLKWRREDVPTIDAPIRPVDLWLSFTPDRTTALWAPVPTEKLPSRDEERKRMSFGSTEPLRKGSKLSHPSTLECFLELEYEGVKVGDLELQERVIGWLAPTFQHLCKSLSYFGYGCVHGSCRKMSMVASMGGVGEWTDELGKKFENIYPILIGPIASCEGLASVLKNRCSLIRLSAQAPIAVVSIPPQSVEDIRQDPGVKEWVVIRDVNKLNAPASTLDAIYERRKRLAWEAPFVKR